MRIHMPHRPHFHWPHIHMTERTMRLVGAGIILALFGLMIALMLFISNTPMYGLPFTPPVLIPAL
jgi:hypothetical protein